MTSYTSFLLPVLSHSHAHKYIHPFIKCNTILVIVQIYHSYHGQIMWLGVKSDELWMNKCQITQITINLFHIHVSDVSDHKLSSSGREDVDVRMLGLGRPFVVELINPHASTFTREDIALLQKVMCRSPHERYVKKMYLFCAYLRRNLFTIISASWHCRVFLT